jgi:hypothetical protein
VKKFISGPISAATFVLIIASTLILTISYVYAMACPSDIVDEFDLQLESVTVDGVVQVDLPEYYQNGHVNITLEADTAYPMSRIGESHIKVERVILRFKPIVANPGSYYENFGFDSSDR